MVIFSAGFFYPLVNITKITDELSMRKLLLISSFVILFIGCFNRSTIEGTAAQLSVEGLGEFDTVSVMGSSTKTLIVTNSGETPAEQLSIAGLQPPFDYEGGSFPGTTGTCGSIVPARSSCTIVFEFKPTVGTTHSTSLEIGYYKGSQWVSFTLHFTGKSVPQGELDNTFNSTGILEMDISGDEKITSIHVKPDKKIILVGQTDEGAGSGHAVLARLNPNGSLDTGFGVTAPGYSVLDVAGSSNARVNSSVLMTNGKILLCGSAGGQALLSRVNANGALDSGFGLLGGILKLVFNLLSDEWVQDCDLQSDGKIVVVGESDPLLGNPKVLVGRISSSGSGVDVSFGALGSTLISIGSSTESRAMSVDILSDDKIVIGGYALTGAQRNSFIAKLTANGSLDTTLNSTGKLEIDICGNNLNDEIHSIINTDANQIVVAGYCDTASSGRDLFVARFNDDGSLDTTFGTAGIVKLDLSGLDDVATKLLVQDDKYIVSGYTNDGIKDRQFIIRLNGDGSLDAPFSNMGIKIIDVGTSGSRSLAMALQDDKKIILGGFSLNSDADFSVLRCFP